jgi:hypothetical protein
MDIGEKHDVCNFFDESKIVDSLINTDAKTQIFCECCEAENQPFMNRQLMEKCRRR